MKKIIALVVAAIVAIAAVALLVKASHPEITNE